METITYIAITSITLENIAETIQAGGYNTDLVKYDRRQLNVYFSQDRLKWCYWIEAEERDALFESDEEHELLRALSPKVIFFIQYHADGLLDLSALLKGVLTQYGGWVTCKESYKELFTVENIGDIVLRCP